MRCRSRDSMLVRVPFRLSDDLVSLGYRMYGVGGRDFDFSCGLLDYPRASKADGCAAL